MNKKSNWTNLDNELSQTFIFPDFNSALVFVNKIAKVAEKIGHHPEIWFTWGKVIITTTTHDKQNTLTDKDFELTELIDKIGHL
jgi:4a-hydroxytetrahydrobiopterin dehydratase